MPWKHSLDHQLREIEFSWGRDGVAYQRERVQKDDTPLLFIGLGGAGLRMGSAVRKLFHEHFIPAADPSPAADEKLPPLTRLLALDTDRVDLDHEKYLGSERCEIGNTNIASYLTPENRMNLPDYIREWLNPQLNFAGNGMEGAQMNRQVGRFALFLKADEVVARLCEALNQLRTPYGSVQVIIASGTTGGTGSGILLDVAYLVHHAAAMVNLPANRLRLIALLTTPDVHASLAGPAGVVHRANGYACLKELDYWMEVASRDVAFEQRYSPAISVKWDTRPFNDCFLLSTPSPYQHPLNDVYGLAAEYVASLFGAWGNDPLFNPFRYTSYRYSCYAALSTAPRQYDVCRRFTALGVSSARIPLQHLFLKEAIYLFGRLESYYGDSVHPDLSTCDAFAGLVQQIVGNRAGDLLAAVVPPRPSDIPIRDIRANDHLAPHDPRIDAKTAAFFDALDRRCQGEEANALILDCMRRMEQALTAMFADPMKGPFFASRFIDGAPGAYQHETGDFEPQLPHAWSLVRVLNELRGQAHAKRKTAQAAMLDDQHEAEAAYREIKQKRLLPVMQSSPLANRYYISCDRLFLSRMEFCRQDLLCRLYEDMLRRLDQMNRDVFKPLCTTILELTKTFREIDVYMNGPAYWASQPAYVHDIVDRDLLVVQFQDMYMNPQRVLDMAGTLFGDMMRPFTRDHDEVDMAEQWLPGALHGGTVAINLVNNLQRVLNDLFRPFNSMTLTEALRMQYPQRILPDGSLDLPAIINQLSPEVNCPTPAFPADIVHLLYGPGTTTVTSSYISTPHNVNGLNAAAAPMYVQDNALTDRIIWLRHVDGVSLCHYGPMLTCENDYYHYTGAGVHLYEGRQINWRNLPSPLPRAARMGSTHPRLAEAENAMIARIDRLMKAGMIRIDLNLERVDFLQGRDHSRAFAQEFLQHAQEMDERTFDARYNELLSVFCHGGLHIDPNMLSHYRIRYAGEDALRNLVDEMLIMRPELIALMEEDLPLMESLLAAKEAISIRVTEAQSSRKIIVLLTDLLAFGILSASTPLALKYDDADTSVEVYHTLRDKNGYWERYPGKEAGLIRVAAKLMDMQDVSHAEHDKMIGLVQLEEELHRSLEIGDPVTVNLLCERWKRNAPALRAEVDNSLAMLYMQPAGFDMSAETQRECIDLLQAMKTHLSDMETMLGIG